MFKADGHLQDVSRPLPILLADFRNVKLYRFSSHTEGFTILVFQSEFEKKLCFTRINTIQDINEVNPEMLNIFLKFDDNDPPGDCRLQAIPPFSLSTLWITESILRPNITLTLRYIWELSRIAFQSYVHRIVSKGRSNREEQFQTSTRLSDHCSTFLSAEDIQYVLGIMENKRIQSRSVGDTHVQLQHVSAFVKQHLIFREAQRFSSDRWQVLLEISNSNFGKKLLLKCSSIRFSSSFKKDYLVDGAGRRCMSMVEIEHLWCMGGEKKALVFEECQRICTSIQKISDTILLVWPAYEANDDKKLVFVVYSTEEVKINVDYRIYQKVVGMFDERGRDLAENRSYHENIPLYPIEAEKMREKINQHASTLFQNHRFISGITGSGTRFVGLGTRNLKQVSEPCIVIYVLVKGKIPLNEGQIPKHLGGIPVDIREGDFQTCVKANEYHKNLRMGCQIMSDASGNKIGTLGGFVEHQDYGLCGITCAHVVFNGERLHKCRGKRDDLIKDDVVVFQPNTDRPRHEVGPLRLVTYRSGENGLPGVDLAMFQIKSRPPESGMFPKHSDDSQSNLLYESGKFAREKQFHEHDQKVVKFGLSSGLTEGYVEFLGTVVRKIDFELEYTVDAKRFTYTLFNQLEIRPPIGKGAFCEGGDSGALVFKKDVSGDLICIGMVVGTFSNGNGIVTPISVIMNELDVSEMKTFTLNRIDEQFNRMEQKIDRLENKFHRMDQILVKIAGKLNIDIPT